MTIKQYGGVFGRNPTFNDVEIEGDLSVDGTLTIGGNVITGLDYEGGWNASTNTPDLTTTPPAAGKFWIVSVAGNTNLGGITNWTQGDWALYDGSAWQRVEGGTVDLTNGVTGILPIANGGTNASDASTARSNLGSGAVGDNLFTATTALAAQQAMDTEVGVDVQPYDATILKSADIGVTVEAYDSTILKSADIGVTVEAYDSTILKSADIGSTVQGYDADTAKYDDTTANFTGTLQNGGSNVVVDSDIGSTVQAYDADTAKLDVAQTWTAKQTFGATDIDGAVVINESGADVDFRIESDTDANAFFLQGSDGFVGIGTSSPTANLHIKYANPGALGANLKLDNNGAVGGEETALMFASGTVRAAISSTVEGAPAYAGNIVFKTGQGTYASLTERMRISSTGAVNIGSSVGGIGTAGCFFSESGSVFSRDANTPLFIERTSTDGVIVSFYQDGSSEGNISVSGSTVSYNGGHLARWSQLPDSSKDETIVKGTVMTNLDAMCEWTHESVEAQEAVYETQTDEEGNEVYVLVSEAVEAKEAYTEDNEQLNRMAVSSVEGDTNVAGVFVNWDNDDDQFNDMNIAMTGDMVIRIAQGVTVNRGDLLMSAGDGTAKPQEDDIVRSKTIAKVTSTHVSHTYDDGSYLVPCVLMAC